MISNILYVSSTKSTHLTQPLDIGLFPPMKRKVEEDSNQMDGKYGKSFFLLLKDKLPMLLNQILVKMEPQLDEK